MPVELKFGIDALKVIFDAAQKLWGSKKDIDEQNQKQREKIAETCGFIADALEEKRDQILEGRGFQAISIPHYVLALSGLLQERLPETKGSDYTAILSEAARAVKILEGMTYHEYKTLNREEKDELISPLNIAIGEFRALSQTIHL